MATKDPPRNLPQLSFYLWLLSVSMQDSQELVHLWHNIRVDENLIGCNIIINCRKVENDKSVVVDGEWSISV
jgi:hypothetical protein